jgi:hypothetical protein
MSFALKKAKDAVAFLQKDLVEIRPSKFGRGLFAVKDLPAHTAVSTINGPLLSFADTILLGERESHAMQIDTDKYILCDPPFLFSNHSCEPNCAVNEDLIFYTLRAIRKNEELLWDYSTSMMERHWQMQCNCDAPICRKIIKDFDLLPPSVQQKYINMNIVLPFVLLNRSYQQGEYGSRA